MDINARAAARKQKNRDEEIIDAYAEMGRRAEEQELSRNERRIAGNYFTDVIMGYGKSEMSEDKRFDAIDGALSCIDALSILIFHATHSNHCDKENVPDACTAAARIIGVLATDLRSEVMRLSPNSD